MDPLPVIPRPPKKKMREFQSRYLPLIVFGCTVAGIIHFWPAQFGSPAGSESVAATREIPAERAEVATNLFVRGITASSAAAVN